MPFFSVIVPTYNRRDRLLRAIQSVLSQRFTDYELIVIDDGSTDGSAEAVLGLGRGIRLLTQKNQGPSAARNAGARAASGEYLAFLDSDDTWFPWTLHHYASLLREHDRPSWICGTASLRADLDPGETPAAGPPTGQRFACYLDAAASHGIEPLPSGVAVAREIFLGAEGFLQGLNVMEDLDLWFRLGCAPGFTYMARPAAFLRELHGGSLGEDTQKSFAALLQLLEREHTGVYPGDARAASVRTSMFVDRLMYYAAQYRRRGHPVLASRFYLEVLRVQARRRFRDPGFGGRPNQFLVTFPLFLASPRLHTLLKRAFGRDGRR